MNYTQSIKQILIWKIGIQSYYLISPQSTVIPHRRYRRVVGIAGKYQNVKIHDQGSPKA